MNETEETRLLALVALRDTKAFQQLYELTSGRLFAIAMTMLGNRAQAEDLLQDAYLRVWYSADTFDASRGEAMGWLVSIVRNRAIDVLRTDKSGLTDDLDVQEAEITPKLEADEKRLADCLKGLDSRQRQSIFAAFFQGLTHHEIAKRFAEPIGTVKSRVRRGLAALKGCLEL